ncbi:3-keto-5-aminohexanoate cleavage protein [Kiloniella laminariae]|uniref:3-keto-5-aminohexanoate cleavage protein n=1 Tax=Kiloniella laminariae TaxID=454162 RepID=A0ABT4LMG4_9PROT|nr:3-keto-5-aminohexanoate cleavage protein [Kiloniella laminariae]MCZ4282298.1 3-keto-5-aminohexanoate cleavage protein [Kiloniella laminariae]
MSPTIIMAAPNGARKTQADHPHLPVTVEQIITEALACQKAGAAMAHLHVRDAQQQHVLDAGLYREVIAGINYEAGSDLLVQITTEAVGRYGQQAQIDCVKATEPEAVSVALREMMPDDGERSGSGFYHWANEAGIHLQHILYDLRDLERFIEFVRLGLIPVQTPSLLFVLGRYASNNLGEPEELDPFTAALQKQKSFAPGPWFTCAFGHLEAACMTRTFQQGGHARVGFENNSKLRNGQEAEATSEIVAQTRDEILALGKKPASAKEARQLLGISSGKS